MNDSSQRELLTARLRLRPFAGSDFDVFVEDLVSDPVVMQFYHSYTPTLTNDERSAKAQTDFLKHFEESRDRYGLETWALMPLDGSVEERGRLIGWAGLLESTIEPSDLGPEVQYMLASRYHGVGLVTEAVRAILADGFDRCGLSRVRAYVDAPNIGSRRVAEKLGFQLQGQVHAYGSDDMVLYVLESGWFQ